jgi:zinc transporter ZupT
LIIKSPEPEKMRALLLGSDSRTSLTADDRFDMLLRVRSVKAGMSRWVAALRLIGIGFFIGGSILLGAVAGLWLDDRLNTGPILVIAGVILGVAVAFYGVYQMLLPFLHNKSDKENS